MTDAFGRISARDRRIEHALIAAGASAPVLFDQFISEKEGNALVAVMSPGDVWSLCHGVTLIKTASAKAGMLADVPGSFAKEAKYYAGRADEN